MHHRIWWPLVVLTFLSTALTAYLATSHCCDRINVLAAVGLDEPG